jgi:sugar fermentation stimulation protein A
MQFPSTLVPGTLIKRYKRFLADVALDSGEEVTAHCANPGSMLGLNMPGTRVWLSQSDNPKRKLKYSWELLEVDLGRGPALVGINTSHPNLIVADAIAAGKVAQLTGYGSLRREVKYGRNSRIDMLLEDDARPPCYVEVKNVHLMRRAGFAEFPDSVTARGAKHLVELADMVGEGARAVMFFLVQRDDASSFSLAADMDPHYSETFEMARRAGVETLVYSCKLDPLVGIELDRQVPFVHEAPAT